MRPILVAMAAEGRGDARRPHGAPAVLLLVPEVPAVLPRDRRVVVLDTTWTAPPDAHADGPLAFRDVARGVLVGCDPIELTAGLLDGWAAATGVADALTVDGTSYWFYMRLNQWVWLQTRILWLQMVDALVRTTGAGTLQCAPGVDPELIEAARALGEPTGLEVLVEEGPVPLAVATPSAASAPRQAAPPARRPTPPGPPFLRRLPGAVVRRVRRLGRRVLERVGLLQPRPPSRAKPTRPSAKVLRARIEAERADRMGTIWARVDALARQPGRLLVVLEHARQTVDGPDGPRLMNAYLGPIVERLRGGRLDPVELDIRAHLIDDPTWARLTGAGSERLLPLDAVNGVPEETVPRPTLDVDAMVARIGTAPAIVAGVDLGPDLRERVVDTARRVMPGRLASRDRIRWLLRRLRPAAVLLADEYHRQDWLSAAAAEGIRTVAMQHGLIYRWHNGYMHPTRPPGLRVPDRTYVFGRFERRLLTETSVYRPDEVHVGGSPRLDLLSPASPDREALRRSIGVEPHERLVVVSGTWGQIYRRFHYAIALADLVDRPLPGVHFVIKLHPGEKDEGPYRAIIERAAAARGLPAPRVTIVQAVDLYRLLEAADAHLGVHSTVLSEAVITGTPNLLAASLAGADLVGYVAAGVAVPVRDGGDLLAALDPSVTPRMTEAARRAFIEDHFEPGRATDRITGELLDWLS
jgi:hypothetical protein